MKVIQVSFVCSTEREATQAFDGWSIQDDFMGGRVFRQYNRLGNPEWVFQGFFPCASELPYGPQDCEGMRVVELSDSMRKTFRTKVMRYESSVMEPEAAEEFLTEMSQADAFIGAVTESTQYGVRVILFFPANGQPFGPVTEFWSVTWLPATYMKWHTAVVTRPANKTWGEYARDMQKGALRDAVMTYLATWDYIAPDKITVKYLA
jgi:hypothetical protein